MKLQRGIMAAERTHGTAGGGVWCGKTCIMRSSAFFLDFKLSPCSEYCMLSSSIFIGR